MAVLTREGYCISDTWEAMISAVDCTGRIGEQGSWSMLCALVGACWPVCRRLHACKLDSYRMRMHTLHLCSIYAASHKHWAITNSNPMYK